MSAAAILLSPAAYADPPGPEAKCEAVTIAAPPELSPRWSDAVAQLRVQVAGLAAAECAAARLTVLRDEPRESGVVLRIVAADGRQTERRVSRPTALVPVALGLIASIPTEATLSRSQPPDENWNDMPREVPVHPKPAKISPAPPRSPFGASLAVGLGARLGGPTGVLMGEVEVRADFVVHDWIVLAAARYAPIGARVAGARIPGYAYTELAAGIGFGRRFALGATALDVVVTPEFVVMDEEGDVPSDGTGGTFTYFRFDAAARWLFAHSGSWRFGVTADADFAPYSLGSPPTADPRIPLLPTWSVGTRFVAAGDLL